MTETLNDRLDRMELAIKSLSDKINQIKPADINKKQVTEMLSEISKNLEPIKVEIDVKKDIKTVVTRDFVTELYRGK